MAQNLGTESKKAERDPQADASEEDSGRNIPDGTHVGSIDPPVELPLGIIVLITHTRRMNNKKSSRRVDVRLVKKVLTVMMYHASYTHDVGIYSG